MYASRAVIDDTIIVQITNNNDSSAGVGLEQLRDANHECKPNNYYYEIPSDDGSHASDRDLLRRVGYIIDLSSYATIEDLISPLPSSSLLDQIPSPPSPSLSKWLLLP
jgi:hypothetical protein